MRCQIFLRRKRASYARCLAIALIGLASARFVGGAELPEADAPRDKPVPFNVLDTIIVSATLNERPQKDVAAQTSVIDASEIERRLAKDIRDLVRYEPGVSVAGGGARFGLNGFTIRGLDGNRVRILVDGIAVPDAFAIGSPVRSATMV